MAVDHKCGTVCCAVGLWAHRQAGNLYLKKNGMGELGIYSSDGFQLDSGSPHGCRRMRAEFDLDDETYEYLFLPGSYGPRTPTACEVADRIRCILKANQYLHDKLAALESERLGE